MILPNTYAGPVTAYSEEVAAGIGRLMPFLDPSFSNDPTPRDRLEKLIASPYHDQLIVVRNSFVVGAATMSLVMGAGFGERSQLEDFVVDPEARGTGVSDEAWDSMLAWTNAHVSDAARAEMGFETEEYRPDAVKFYAKKGAKIIPHTHHLRATVPDALENTL